MSFSLNVLPEPRPTPKRPAGRRLPSILLALVLGLGAITAYDAVVTGGQQRKQLAEVAERAIEVVRAQVAGIWRG